MEKIPTAEELLKDNFYNGSHIEIHSSDKNDIKELMIEFAKFHVKQALNDVSEKLEYFEGKNNENTIKEMYSLKNIK